MSESMETSRTQSVLLENVFPVCLSVCFYFYFYGELNFFALKMEVKNYESPLNIEL